MLSISGDTVKYVGIIAAIVLPLIILLIGYQVIRSYQFEREIRETRKLMMDEYQKILDMRTESEKLITETKSKMENLKEFVGDLATDFLTKMTPKLFSEFKGEVKEQANQAIAEIKTKDEEIARSIELMKKLETLDLTLTPSVYIERGRIYLDQRNPEKAIENFNKAIELHLQFDFAYIQRGLTYAEMKKNDLAINDLKEAERLNPNSVSTLSNIGLCYGKMGRVLNSNLRTICARRGFSYKMLGETTLNL